MAVCGYDRRVYILAIRLPVIPSIADVDASYYGSFKDGATHEAVGIKSRTATPPQPIPSAPFFGYYVSDPETYFHAVWDLNDDLFDTYNGGKTEERYISSLE